MNGLAYYNEHDPRAAAWLRELIRGGHIAPGDVDERSIADVWPGDLRAYTQCHFFAGIGGWSLALRLAGWPDDVPVWTGSCPCQPFSCAGKRRGTRDARHLWPKWARLIAEANGLFGVPVIFGEQVASADGRQWVSGVRSSLEALAYRVGIADLCAASVSAPHIRQRLFWVAQSGSQSAGRIVFGPGEGPGAIGERTPDQFRGSSSARGLAHHSGAGPFSGALTGIHRGEEGAGPRDGELERCGAIGRMADADGGEPGDGGLQRGGRHLQFAPDETALRLDQPHGDGWQPGQHAAAANGHGSAIRPDGGNGWMGEPIQPGLEGHAGHGDNGGESGRLDPAAPRSIAEAGSAGDRLGDAEGERRTGRENDDHGGRRERALGHSSAWSNFDLTPCADGKARRVESGTFPLAHGVSGRVGLLRGYGNAIVPQVAAQFIQAYLEARGEMTP